MKLKRAVVVFGSLIILVIIFTVYTAKDLTLSVRKTTITQELKDVRINLHILKIIHIYLFVCIIF